MSLYSYHTRGIVQALNEELHTDLYGITAISELDSQERAESWPDPIDAPARAWNVTVHPACQKSQSSTLYALIGSSF
jgi:hypothetical protein